MTTEELNDEVGGAETDGAEPSVNHSPAPNLGREVKVGLSVIGTLMTVLAGIVYVKMGMPGIKTKQVIGEASPAGQHAAAPLTEEPPQVLAEPVHVPTSDTAVDPFSPRGGADRYAAQQSPPPPDMQGMPPAEPPMTPFGDSTAGRYDRGDAGGVQTVAATEPEPPAPLANHELPPEPGDAGPLVPAAEPQLQAPQTENEPAGDPRGVNQAAHEPPVGEPQEAPYGSRYTDDRYGAAQQPAAAAASGDWNKAGEPAPHAPGHAAPHAAAEHVPPHAAAPHNAPAAATHAPPPHHDLPYEHADLAQRPTRDGTYVVEPNDSFWTISQKVYDAPGFFKALQRHNRKPGTPNVGLVVGDKISTPSVEVLRREYPNLCPKPRTAAAGGAAAYSASSRGAPHTGRVYVVQEGDTLFDIARYELGKASRWAEVYELNRDQLGDDYNHLAPGMRLALPADAANDSDNVTSRQATPYK